MRQGRRARGCGRRRQGHRAPHRRPRSADPSVSGAATLTTIAVASTPSSSTATRNDPTTRRRTTRTRDGERHEPTATGTSPPTRTCRRPTSRRTRTSCGAPATPTRARSRPYESELTSLPRRRRPAADVRPGHPRPGGRARRRSCRLPAHQLGRHGGPERQGDRDASRRSRATRSPTGLGHACRSTTASWARPSRTRSRRSPRARRRSTTTPAATDALTVASGAYKVFFLAFPFEAFGTAADKATLVGNTLSWFATP